MQYVDFCPYRGGLPLWFIILHDDAVYTEEQNRYDYVIVVLDKRFMSDFQRKLVYLVLEYCIRSTNILVHSV